MSAVSFVTYKQMNNRKGVQKSICKFSLVNNILKQTKPESWHTIFFFFRELYKESTTASPQLCLGKSYMM